MLRWRPRNAGGEGRVTDVLVADLRHPRDRCLTTGFPVPAPQHNHAEPVIPTSPVPDSHGTRPPWLYRFIEWQFRVNAP